MKRRWLAVLLTLLLGAFGVVLSLHATDDPGTTTQRTKPADRSEQLAQARIQFEASEAAKAPDVRPVAEAKAAVDETRKAVRFLERKQPARAKAALQRAIGKADTALAGHPDMALVPISVDIQVVDTAPDEATLTKITEQATAWVDEGRFQAARLLLRNLASEIDVATVNLPTATYPAALRAATTLIEQKKLSEAKVSLEAALQTLVMAEKAIPLPVLRAQTLVDEGTQLASREEPDKAKVDALLSAADRQLSLAEKLGYGTRKEDIDDLQNTIKYARDIVEQDQEATGLFTKVKHELKALKEKLSLSSKEIS